MSSSSSRLSAVSQSESSSTSNMNFRHCDTDTRERERERERETLSLMYIPQTITMKIFCTNWLTYIWEVSALFSHHCRSCGETEIRYARVYIRRLSAPERLEVCSSQRRIYMLYVVLTIFRSGHQDFESQLPPRVFQVCQSHYLCHHHEREREREIEREREREKKNHTHTKRKKSVLIPPELGHRFRTRESVS